MKARWLRSALSITLAVAMFATSVPVQADETIAVTGVIQEESAWEDAEEAESAERIVGEETVIMAVNNADETVKPAIWYSPDLIVTQVPNGDTSHMYYNAFDVIGPYAYYSICAPFDGTIVDIFSAEASGNTVVLQSKEEVLYANGKRGFMSIALTHDNNISDLWVGKEIATGTPFYQTGNYGMVTGIHSHVVCIEGKYTDHPGWRNVYKPDGSPYYYGGNIVSTMWNDIYPTEALWILPNTNAQTMGMNFKTYSNPPTISEHVTASPNNKNGFTVTYEIGDDLGIASYSTNVWLYGQDPSQAKRYENIGLGADGKTVTVDISPADFNGYDGIYYVGAEVIDTSGFDARATLDPDDRLDLYVTTAEKKEVGTFKVTKDVALFRNSPFEKVNGFSTDMGCLAKNQKVEVVGKYVNSYGNDWYRMADGNWIYSGNIKKVTMWVSILETLQKLFDVETYYWAGQPVSKAISVKTAAKSVSSANLQFRVSQFTAGTDSYSGSWHTIYFDGNGGASRAHSISRQTGSAYGYLPTSYRSGYNFDGWFTAAEGGSQVVSSDIFNASGDMTLYAHWTRIILLEGECGPNLHFILYGDGELDITGSGEMTSHPWTDGRYRDSVLEVVLPDGLTKICLEAFAYCVNLGSVSIPDSVTEIVDGAFRNCEKMEAVRLPQNLAEIKEVVFACCYELEQITIPESVTKIGGAAFARCSSLSAVNLPEGLVQLDAEAFFDCDSLTEITIPKALTKSNSIYRYEFVYDYQIGPFYGCDGLKTVHFEEGITNILPGLFAHCPGIEAITIPDTVKIIEDNAFYDCGHLSSVTMYDGLEQLKVGAFGKCISLTAIDIPDTVTKIGGAAFARCTSLADVHLPMSLKQIDAEAFFDCDAITEITLPPAVEKSDSQYFYEYVYDYQIGPFYGCDGLKTVKFTPDATDIGPAMFANCPGLEQIEIADTVTRIGANAFSNCSNLKDVKLSSGLTQMDSYAFSNCDGLVEITIPKSLQNNQNAEGIFRDSDNLKTVKFEEGLTEVPNRLFSDCSALECIEFPASLEKIGVLSFAGCQSLKEVVIPDHVSEINLGAFANCKNLTSVQLPKGLKQIYNKAFGYTRITEITIPAGLENVVDGYAHGVDRGEGVFAQCMDLKTAKFEDGATKVPANLFKNCPGLERIEFPESMEKIENYAFANCDGLKTVELPDGITSIGVAAFRDCSNLEMIQLPDGLTEIGNVAFSNTALTEVTIPAGVSKFLNAYGLGFGWSEGIFANCQQLKTARFQEGTIKVLAYFFKNCPGLEMVEIPATVSTIENSVFDNSPNVTICGYPGSYAEQYANGNTIPFVDADSRHKLAIEAQPQTVTAGLKAKISFHITAVNAISYQWQYSKNGGAKWLNSSVSAGGNTDTVNLTVSTSNAGSIYRCVVTGKDGTKLISDTAGIDLLPGVVITLNPRSNAVAIGEYATFTVETENAASFQWQYSKDGAHWYRSGAEGNQTDTLLVKGEQKSQGNRYRCVVTGIDGNTKKSYMAAMIVMTVAPKTCTAQVGETASYSLKAEGIATYQWQYSKDGGNTWYRSSATGADTDTVSFRVTATNRSMLYRCRLTTPDEATAYTKPVGF